MDAKEMLMTVQNLKDLCIINGFLRTREIDKFFEDNYLQILDILDDALYNYLYDGGH